MSLEALQSIDGLWLIESVHSEVGGKLQFGEVFRLKNLSTSRYLAFSKSFKEVNRERIHDIFLDS